MQRLVRVTGPQPDGPVNQNNELKVAEVRRAADGGVTFQWLAVLLLPSPYRESFDSKLISKMPHNGE